MGAACDRVFLTTVAPMASHSHAHPHSDRWFDFPLDSVGRRLAIAVEILNEPSLLVLDDTTSALDPSTFRPRHRFQLPG